MLDMTAPIAAPSAAVAAADLTGLFTCMACHVAFHAASAQRAHYHTDWHRYNLKRRVAALPPLSADQFAARVLEERARVVEESTGFDGECRMCGKRFASEGMLEQHMASRKHKERAVAVARGEAKSAKPSERRAEDDVVSGKAKRMDDGMMDTPETEEDLERIMKERLASAPRLAPTDCIFCAHVSVDLESNVEHMTKEHGMFIPDRDYLVDLPGLIAFLGEKVSVTNVCLLCNGRGRGMRSLEAVRQHMIDKGHTMIAYDSEADRFELVDYYDFRPSYPDYDPEQLANGEDETELRPSMNIEFGDTEFELVLPSGARIGHRSLKQYYKQRLTLPDSDEEAEEGRQRRRLHVTSSTALTLGKDSEQRALALMTGHQQREMIKRGARDREVRRRVDYEVGLRANKLMKHFRAQILF